LVLQPLATVNRKVSGVARLHGLQQVSTDFLAPVSHQKRRVTRCHCALTKKVTDSDKKRHIKACFGVDFVAAF
jgi:hypothetical protein